MKSINQITGRAQLRAKLEALLLSEQLVSPVQLAALGEPGAVQAAVDSLVARGLAWQTGHGLVGRRRRIVHTLRTVLHRGPEPIPTAIAEAVSRLGAGSRRVRADVERTEVAAVLAQLTRAGELDQRGTMVGLPGWWPRRLIWPRLAELGPQRVREALLVISRTKSLDAAATRTHIPASTLQSIVDHGPAWLEAQHG